MFDGTWEFELAVVPNFLCSCNGDWLRMFVEVLGSELPPRQSVEDLPKVFNLLLLLHRTLANLYDVAASHAVECDEGVVLGRHSLGL